MQPVGVKLEGLWLTKDGGDRPKFADRAGRGIRPSQDMPLKGPGYRSAMPPMSLIPRSASSVLRSSMVRASKPARSGSRFHPHKADQAARLALRSWLRVLRAGRQRLSCPQRQDRSPISVFIAYFNQEREQHDYRIDHIDQFLKEAQAGKCQIFTSTVTIAEITDPTLKAASVGSVVEILNDFQSSIFLMEADPNTMAAASHLRSQRYTKQDGAKPRQLSPPDAIHLATAINLKPMYALDVGSFHTFDAGKSRGLDGGKGMLMLGFEEWAVECSSDSWVKRVLGFQRSKPEHPSSLLNLD